MVRKAPPGSSSSESMYFSDFLYFPSCSTIDTRKQVRTEAKGRKSIGEDVSCPRESRRAPVVKTEPVNSSEVL